MKPKSKLRIAVELICVCYTLFCAACFVYESLTGREVVPSFRPPERTRQPKPSRMSPKQKKQFQEAFAKAWQEECAKPYDPTSPGAKVAKRIVAMWDAHAAASKEFWASIEKRFPSKDGG